jgi:hypothetical protein
MGCRKSEIISTCYILKFDYKNQLIVVDMVPKSSHNLPHFPALQHNYDRKCKIMLKETWTVQVHAFNIMEWTIFFCS